MDTQHVSIGGIMRLRSAVLSQAFTFSCLLAMLPAGVPGAAAASSPAAEVTSIQGDGQFRPGEGDPWSAALVHQDLFGGNYVRTGGYSRMGILFADRTQIRLNEKTVLQVKEVRDPAIQKSRTLLRLNLGRAWSQSKSPPKGLIMETPSATAAIRGTSWELSVDEGSTAVLTVFSGEVDFYNDFGRVLVKASEQARAVPGHDSFLSYF